MLDHRASFLDLFRTPNMRIKSLSIFFNWTVCGMDLFGMSQYIGQVGGDIFINFAVSGAIQIPGNFVAWWAMNKLGRRITLICSNSVAGVACLFLIIVPNGKNHCVTYRKQSLLHRNTTVGRSFTQLVASWFIGLCNIWEIASPATHYPRMISRTKLSGRVMSNFEFFGCDETIVLLCWYNFTKQYML